ncbi:MAG: hypoxanthine phosphoribosyltransferase [Clostridia bacterium]|nr:hypoxanthine phosphoribosyltransferase [Clostridia bacterium]
MGYNVEDQLAYKLIDEQEISQIVDRLAEQINADYSAPDKRLLLLCILKGSVVFMGEIMKRLRIPVEIDFMKVSSYGAGTVTSGNVHIMLDLLRKDLEQCDILIVEDIIDSGRTLAYLTQYLTLKGAKSVKTCTLLDKPYRREVEFDADYVGKEIPDAFVVGFGLDYNEAFRALPYVAVLKPEVYEK